VSEETGALESCAVEAIQEWLDEGNTPLPADPPAPPTRDELDATAVSEHARLVALSEMSPTQVEEYVALNITDLATAKRDIATLAVGMSILARQFIKQQTSGG
jgi:hypothetical protein